jgi:serine protease Do
MKKAITGAAIIAALAAIAVVAVAVARPTAQAPGILMLEGPGSAIGVTVRETTAEDVKAAKLERAAGVVIESVRSGSPAEKAGFRTGDLVVEFDGERVRSVQHFTRLVRETPPRRTVNAVIVRGAARQTLDVIPEVTGDFRTDARERLRLRGPDHVLRDFNFNFDQNFDRNLLRRAPAFGGPTLGVTVTALTSQLAEYFGVKDGALVTAVQSGSPAADAGLKAGDVITAIAGRSVSTASDIAEGLRRAESGDGVDLSITRERKTLMLKATIPAVRPLVPSGRSGLPV